MPGVCHHQLVLHNLESSGMQNSFVFRLWNRNKCHSLFSCNIYATKECQIPSVFFLQITSGCVRPFQSEFRSTSACKHLLTTITGYKKDTFVYFFFTKVWFMTSYTSGRNQGFMLQICVPQRVLLFMMQTFCQEIPRYSATSAPQAPSDCFRSKSVSMPHGLLQNSFLEHKNTKTKTIHRNYD